MCWKTIICVATILTLAPPATASASNKPVLTQPTGTAIGVGTTFIGRQIGELGFYATSGTKELGCSSGSFIGSILKNASGTVEAEITSAVFGGSGPQVSGEPAPECTGLGFFTSNLTFTALSLPWCLKSTVLTAEDEFLVIGGKCGSVAEKLRFMWSPTGFGDCEYQATQTNIKGKFNTDTSGAASLSWTKTNSNAGFTKISGSFSCPSSMEFEVSFALETDNGSHEPIFISKLP